MRVFFQSRIKNRKLDTKTLLSFLNVEVAESAQLWSERKVECPHRTTVSRSVKEGTVFGEVSKKE